MGTFFFRSSRRTGQVVSTVSETTSCGKSRHAFNNLLVSEDGPMETGEQNVPHISFNHNSLFQWDFNHRNIFTLKLLKEKQASGEPGVREEKVEQAKC